MPPALTLNPTEIRVLGCLLEKQHTTPDAYPLSLNALRLACNQSTNRDPVLELQEGEIREALDRLQRRGLTRLASGAGSRAAKYRHLLADALPMQEGERAVLCVLMLRGAQTPGELKQRAERMHAFGTLADVQDTLERLIAHELAERLPRRPGQKEERYAQLLGGREQTMPGPASAARELGQEPPLPAQGESAAPAPSQPPGADPAQDLRERVARLEREVAELRAAMRDPLTQVAS